MMAELGRLTRSVGAAGVLAMTLAGGLTEAGIVKRFATDTPRALTGGRGKGVGVFADGSLRPVGTLDSVATFDEPLGLALAVLPDGTAYVGTGHPARIYRVRGRTRELIGDVAADQVTAMLVDPSGTLWAATAVPALLVRLPAGGKKLEEVSRLSEGNLWDLAWFRGSLIGAAGRPGRLVRLGAKGLERAADIPDAHARCLAPAGDSLLVGTSGKGLVLRWRGEGAPEVLADSTFTEIAALAVAPDGTAWAAALTGDPTMGKPAEKEPAGAEASVTVSEGAGPAPSAEKTPSTSEILRILPGGAVTTVHRFPKQIAGTLAWSERGTVIGTGLEGEVWQLVDGAAAQLDGVDAAQVVRIAGAGAWVLTQGPVRLWRRSEEPKGTFTSPPLDAGQPAHWGELAVRGDFPAQGACRIRFRSGATAEPGDEWNAWSANGPCDSARVGVPPARHLQWQVELSGAAVRVERVQVAYRQVNLEPEIKDFVVHEPGEVFLKVPPPSDRIVEVQHPDLSGIFTTLDDDAADRQVTLGKKYYRVGYQSLSWKAEDPNGDPLRFSVEVQEAGRDVWWPVRESLDTTTIALDTQALPDGIYRFRLVATDEPANPERPAAVSRISSLVTVDNTPPRLVVAREGGTWRITVEDALSAVTRVEWNRDADRWIPLVAEDGALGGRKGMFTLESAAGRHLLAVRAVDAHHNRAIVAVEEQP
ncbi:MAG: hypothetical protein AB1625_01715 [Acidobacteriota bacterium]